MKTQRKAFAAGLFVASLIACSMAVKAPHVASADESKPAAKKEPWKPEDFIYSEAAGQYRISPDARWVVWVKSSGDKDKDGRISNLFLFSLTKSLQVKLQASLDNHKD